MFVPFKPKFQLLGFGPRSLKYAKPFMYKDVHYNVTYNIEILESHEILNNREMIK